MIRVAIIDDHAMVRKGVEYVLGMRKGEFEFVGELGGGEGAAEFVAKTKPDVLLLDIRMPGKDGLEALRDILAANPQQKVVMLTTSEADNDVYQALTLGAKGYLLKDRDSGELVTAVKTVAAGGTFLPSVVQKLYAEREQTANLTERELEVLDLIAKGLSRKEIAEVLDVSADTVKSYTRNIFDKLGVNDRVSATTEGLRRGFIRMEK